MKKLFSICLFLLLVLSTRVFAQTSLGNIEQAEAIVRALSAPSLGNAEQSKAMAMDAAIYFETHGVQKGIEAIHDQSGKFRNGALYIFLFNYKTGVIEGHGVNKSLIGRDLMHMEDADGKLFFQEFKKVAETKGEGWVSYKWPNPVSKRIENKESFVKKINDELLVGCGYYKN